MSIAAPQQKASSVPPELVEQVVHEVLRRLQGGAPPAKVASIAAGSQGASPTSSESSSVPAPRLITLAHVAELAVGSTLSISRRTVITPAARDHLKQHGIVVTRDRVDVSAPRASQRVALATAATRFEPATLVSQLRGAGCEVEQLARGGLAEVVAELAVRVARGGDAGVLLTDDGHAALMLANRRAGVRAVAVSDRDQLGRAIAAVGANLLVVDTVAVRPHQVRPLVMEFCRRGMPGYPEALQRALSAADAS